MTWVIYLLASFGLAFGIQNKLPFLHGEHKLRKFLDKLLRGKRKYLDSLLQCPYCLGFWTGWMTWGLALALEGKPPLLAAVYPHWWQYPISGVLWAFASAVICYLLYVSIVWLEDSLERN